MLFKNFIKFYIEKTLDKSQYFNDNNEKSFIIDCYEKLFNYITNFEEMKKFIYIFYLDIKSIIYENSIENINEKITKEDIANISFKIEKTFPIFFLIDFNSEYSIIPYKVGKIMGLKRNNCKIHFKLNRSKINKI
jgi:hypothetical protein